MSILARANDALNINPPIGDHQLTVHGSDWLWTVTAIYAFTLVGVVISAYFARSGEKIFHYLFTISLFAGTIAYFTVASDLGSVAVQVADNATTSPDTREIFYARYINWFTSWPPLLIAIGLLSGVSWTTTVYNISLLWIWVVTWLSSSLVTTTYKWGFFTFGLISYLLLAISLLHTGLTTSSRLAAPHHAHNFFLTSYLTFVWMIYSIAFGVDDGGNKISVTHGWIFFGILDVFTGPFFIAAFLVLARKWDLRVLGLYFTQYGRVASAEGEFPEREKTAPAAAPARLRGRGCEGVSG
ncbi:hypothetical protein G7Y89_g2313 [Cudoniella acicularis]|uniref:Protein FDD123 n=1 Tax=Cudoniella acicularis TaxID=354080 RepID=A0A8H4RWJ4_9HELO|nr:hypothetical protein G7Y89_g2313 [Cudoniella acicularis]